MNFLWSYKSAIYLLRIGINIAFFQKKSDISKRICFFSLLVFIPEYYKVSEIFFSNKYKKANISTVSGKFWKKSMLFFWVDGGKNHGLIKNKKALFNHKLKQIWHIFLKKNDQNLLDFSLLKIADFFNKTKKWNLQISRCYNKIVFFCFYFPKVGDKTLTFSVLTPVCNSL